MSRISLRGVIVPSEYDASWAAPYIDKGIIMPESRFRAMLSGAAKNEPLTVYVNSPGGSVFSAGEMVNAVREWKAETKQPVNIVLGALTASAASAFAIMVADKISAHANAKMMFHGAWTVSVGGKELHQDTAELLEKINGDIKTRLVSKYGMAPETVATWFAEGREGWLSARELVDAKLASEIIEDPSDVIEFKADALGEIEARGLGIAAFAKTMQPEKQEAQNDVGNTVANDGADTSDTVGKPGAANEPDSVPAGYDAGVAAGAAAEAAKCADAIEQHVATARKLQGEKDKARAEVERLKADSVAQIEAHKSELSKLQSEHAAMLADMKEKLATAQAKCERLVSGGMTFSPDSADKGMKTAGDVDPRNRLHPALR